MTSALSTLDMAIVIGYMAITMAVGLWMTRRASASLDDYFLGGRHLPWYLLGIAGMTAWFDLTGTMIITSFLYMLGPRGLFIEFRGGAVLILAFLIAYTGKWHRRSGVMTSAEWNTYRYGGGKSALFVRLLTAVVGIVTTISMLAYLVRGTSLFVGMFLPWSPVWVTVGIIAFAAVYTMCAGFYGVVLTDLVQGMIVLCACVIVSLMAFNLVGSQEHIAELARQVTGNGSWAGSLPAWHTEMPRGYEMYESLIMFAAFYLLRNVLFGFGTGAESRYFAARNDRDCGLQSLLQGVTVSFRWPMMMGFAVLGILLVQSLFPDPSGVANATSLIKQYMPAVTQSNWHELTNRIINHAAEFPPALIDGLRSALGQDWMKSLPLVGYQGVVDPERILPGVIANSIPSGLKGLLLVAMLAATMSNLTGQVNAAGALFVKDIYQLFMRPKASNRELITASYLSTAGVVIMGLWMGVTAKNINDLWGWIIMGLTVGTMAPMVLRLYWWRLNAWGVVGGTLVGGIGAIVQRVMFPQLPEWQQFLVMGGLSIGGTLLGTFTTQPVAMDTLRHFYRTTRPFGWWGPLRKEIEPAELAGWQREHRNDLMSVPFLLISQVCIFMMSMQLIIHAWQALAVTASIYGVAAIGVWWFWWRNLPAADSVAGMAKATDKKTEA